jgi:prepilin-type processing-associated H-X9-DG protein
LLIVIEIIGLLVGLAFPSLRAARAQGKSVACAANMRSVSHAMAMYADQNNDSFPVTVHVSQEGGWIRSVGDIVQDTSVYRCPADPSDDWFQTTDSPDAQLINDRKNSYAVNIYISPRKDPPPGAIDTRPKYGFLVRRMIRFPGDTVHFGELVETSGSQNAGDHLHADLWAPNFMTGQPGIDPKSEVALKRHLRAENYAFVDGHVEAHEFRQTFELDAEKTRVLKDKWNPDRSVMVKNEP